ncbi:unnamed protein product [Moneuplotes crassus]|uniref:Uncharacterized protein n=1 Tax=Euplotes crassus TaxID=5936 RepID=A0AAD1U382_EUPCR|nr:unnamed protein product [Moneuplotes crassus]
MVNLSVNDSVKSLNVNQRTPKAGQANKGSEIFCDRKPKVKRSKSFTNSPQIKKIAEVRETKAERFKTLLSLLTKDITSKKQERKAPPVKSIKELFQMVEEQK